MVLCEASSSRHRRVPPRYAVTNGGWRRAVRVAFGVAAFAVATGLHAAGLFLPVAPTGAKAAKADVSPPTLASTRPRVPDARERRVRIARQELAAARDDVGFAGAGRLLLNVRDGVRLDVLVERTAPTKWGYSLSGRVAGGGTGFVTLVVHEEASAGTIWTPDSAWELSYLGGGVHALRDVTNAPPPECGGTLRWGLPVADETAQGGTDGSSVVDILVVWTPAVEEKAGGLAQVLSFIDRHVAATNDAFERSGALVALRLVAAERVEYSETDMHADLVRLITPDDGHLDRVHDRRDTLGADQVYLAADFPGAVNGGAFSAGTLGAFAHEIGHSFGLLHERYELLGVETYNHGFSTSCSPTIMSYGTECKYNRYLPTPVFASPWRYDLAGNPIGVTRFSKDRGVRGPADAVLTLNRNRHRIANLRPSGNTE